MTPFHIAGGKENESDKDNYKDFYKDSDSDDEQEYKKELEFQKEKLLILELLDPKKNQK